MRILIFIYFFLYNIISCSSQDLPPISDVLTISPEWSYISEDTNWYPMEGNPINHDEFIGRIFIKDEIAEDNYYFLEASYSLFLSQFLEGYFLHKIDLDTGEASWVHRGNYFSGNEHIETTFVGDFLIEEEKIYLCGFKSRPNFTELEAGATNFVNFMNHTFDEQTGEKLEERLDTSTLETRKHYHAGLSAKCLADRYSLKTVLNREFTDGFLKSIVDFYLIDQNGYESITPVFTYEYNTGVDVNVLGIHNFPLGYLRLNNDVSVGIFGAFDPGVGQQPINLVLTYFDTSDPLDIKVTKEVDAFPYVPSDQYTFTNSPSLRVNGNTVTVHQKATFENGERYLWITIYDNEGNFVRHIDRLQVEGKDIDHFTPVHSSDGVDYILGRASSETAEGNDKKEYYLFHFDNNNEPKVLTSFSRKEECEECSIFFRSVHLLPNFDLIVYADINFSPEGVYDNYSAIHRFSAEELGITTSVTEINGNKYTISPNPASDFIKVDGTTLDISELYISSIGGKQNRVDLFGGNQISISHLSPGSYFLTIKSISGITETLHFVKI